MNIINPRHRNRQAFTIVETLVAITVLMIAIAGPLVVASKGLNSALFAKDQMIASYLAQESMEIIKNIKDNNLNSTWLSPFSPTCIKSSGSVPTACDVELLQNSLQPTISTSCVGNLGCSLYLSNSGYGYTHDPSGATMTNFRRYFYLETIATDLSRVTVVVSWYEHTIPYEIRLSSEIANASR